MPAARAVAATNGHGWNLAPTWAAARPRKFAGSLLLILPPDSTGQADVWLRRDSAAVIPDDLGQAALIAAGWQQVVSHYDAGVTREHRH